MLRVDGGIDGGEGSYSSGQKIRKTTYRNEWWFSVVDVCAALTDSPDAGAYWRELKQRLKREGSEAAIFCHGLKLPAPDGEMRETDCANTEGIFRIIQSIPSSKAEPFKRWLAKVGCERVKEIVDPELASERMRAIYRAKGYSNAWIEKRMRGIEVRADLANEWEKRGVEEEPEHATYDVNTEDKAGQKRLRRVAKICKNYGQRVQYSVFECLVDPAQWTLLRNRLVEASDPTSDSLRFYFLGANWKNRVEHVGAKPTYDPEGPMIV